MSVSREELFIQAATRAAPVRDLSLRNESDPFNVSLECYLAGIGEIAIEPFGPVYFDAFRRFYDRRDLQWDLSAESRSLSDQHGTDADTLSEIAERVRSRQDAVFVVLTQGHVVGYLDIEEIGRIKAGQKTFFGEDYYAMLDIAISDRFHGTGLAAVCMLFLKLVAAIASVGLGLCCQPANARALRFYRKHGFVRAGHKDIFDSDTGLSHSEPWYILEKNEFEILD